MKFLHAIFLSANLQKKENLNKDWDSYKIVDS